MSLEDFQLIDNEPTDNFIFKREYLKVYHQEGANLNDSNQIVEFINGENNNYLQIGISYLEFDITVRNTAGNFIDASNIRLVNIAFAYCFKEAILPTTGGSDLEHNEFIGQVSSIMPLLTSKDSDSSSLFDENGRKTLNDKKSFETNNN